MFTTKLIEKKEIARDTMSFKWEKPEGLSFRAGQTLDWTLINPPETDDEGNTRTFSIVAAPFEDYLMFATRMRDSAFKRTLKQLEAGSDIQFEGPYGSFTLHNNPDKPAVFLTGGIGVTPAMSIAKQAAHENLPHKIFLFCSNKTSQEAAFLEDFSAVAKTYPNFRFIPTFTQEENPQGEKGRISFEMIQKYVDNIDSAIFYISGPMPMVSALRQTLVDAKVDEDNIKAEDFPGY